MKDMKSIDGAKKSNDLRREFASDIDDYAMLIGFLQEYGYRDQREMMERPFFALSKSRTEPIDYTSPDGRITVKVSADPIYGLATIWDADVLIYLASVVCEMKRRGRNDIPRKVSLRPHNLLRGIGRSTGGREYERLSKALDRLVATTVKTNVRAEGRREATFSWLDGWSQIVDENEMVCGITLELSNWFYDGLVLENSVLKIDPRYFDLKGGLERWLYRVARKHAGSHGSGGFEISLSTLHEKSGSTQALRYFKRDILKIVDRNELPGIKLSVTKGSRQTMIKMVYIGEKVFVSEDTASIDGCSRVNTLENPAKESKVVDLAQKRKAASASAGEGKQRAKSHDDDHVDASSLIGRITTKMRGKATHGFLEATTIEYLREKCPGWDLYALHAEFTTWVEADPERQPADWQAAFIGWVKKHHEKNRHSLGR